MLETILFVGDAHVPYEDKRAWELVMKVGRALKPKHLVCMGDLADFYSVSAHSKSPERAHRLDWEIETTNHRIDQLDAIKASNKLYIAGNHEDRLRRYLESKAPELFGVVDIPTLFSLKNRGWKYTPYREFTQLGKLYLTHDVGVSGPYAVFRAASKFQHSVVTGHTHRIAYEVSGDATGDRKVAASFGWLGDVNQADYMFKISANTSWSLGFGVGYLDKKTGFVHLQPVVISPDYKCVVEGKEYGG